MARLKGRTVRIIAPDGSRIDTFVKLGLAKSKDGPKTCSIMLTEPGTDDPRKRTYLTDEALQMVTPAPEWEHGTDFVIDFSRAGTDAERNPIGEEDLAE